MIVAASLNRSVTVEQIQSLAARHARWADPRRVERAVQIVLFRERAERRSLKAFRRGPARRGRGPTPGGLGSPTVPAPSGLREGRLSESARLAPHGAGG